MAREQLDLFAAAAPEITPAPAAAAPPRPVRSRRARSTGRPEVAAEVLTDVHHGKYGLLDDGDRFVVFEDDTRVRLAADENVLASLAANGYIERRPARDTVSCRHGAIRRPVTPLRLTKHGQALLNRWSALTPLGKKKQAVKITSSETTMTTTGGHSAHAVDEQEPYGQWRVSWLRDRAVSRNQAITALMIAAHVTAGVTDATHRHWTHVASWAAELDMSPEEAVDAVQRATPDHTGQKPRADDEDEDPNYVGPNEDDRMDMTAAFLWSRLKPEDRRGVLMHLSFEEQDTVQRGVRRGRKLIREAQKRARERDKRDD